MKAFILKRPWVIVVAVQVVFIAWWVGFVIYASHHTPADVEPTQSSHVIH
jgi:hypothetical protein